VHLIAEADPSACVERATSTYLVDLVTPRPGTVCRSDRQPFAPDFGKHFPNIARGGAPPPRRGRDRGADPNRDLAVARQRARRPPRRNAGRPAAQARRPKRLIRATAYGNIEVRERLEKRKVAVLAPVHTTSPSDGTFGKDDSAIELQTDTVTCPRGKRAPISCPLALRVDQRCNLDLTGALEHLKARRPRLTIQRRSA
jgi:hypothetical protein